jgi:hypothetical protein
MKVNPLPTSQDVILTRLVSFNEEADKMYRFSFHSKASALGNGFTITFDTDKPFSVDRRLADEESTHALIDVLRLLVQKKDQLSFEQIVEMHQTLQIPLRKKEVAAGTLAELDKYLATGCSVQFHDWAFTRGELFDVFMYGKYAHRNLDKQGDLRRFVESKVFVLLESDFEDILLTYIEYALWFKAFNQSVINILTPRTY